MQKLDLRNIIQSLLFCGVLP